jgi:hypothetical protein
VRQRQQRRPVRAHRVLRPASRAPPISEIGKDSGGGKWDGQAAARCWQWYVAAVVSGYLLGLE